MGAKLTAGSVGHVVVKEGRNGKKEKGNKPGVVVMLGERS